jgi:hypothetical protein
MFYWHRQEIVSSKQETVNHREQVAGSRHTCELGQNEEDSTRRVPQHIDQEKEP